MIRLMDEVESYVILNLDAGVMDGWMDVKDDNNKWEMTDGCCWMTWSIREVVVAAHSTTDD